MDTTSTSRSNGPTLIQSVQRALRLLEVVAEREGRANVKTLARAAGIAPPTAYHLLRTLTYEGYLERTDAGFYVLGERLGVTVQGGSAVRAVARARPVLRSLRDSVHSAVYLALYDGGEIEVADVVDGPKAPRVDLWVGMHDAAHATAVGKAILRHLDPETRAQYFANHPLHSLTRYTRVGLRSLSDELDRPVPLSFDSQEYSLGVSCIAAPVLGPDVVGSIGIHVRSSHVDEVRATGETLMSAAARVARALAVP